MEKLLAVKSRNPSTANTGTKSNYKRYKKSTIKRIITSVSSAKKHHNYDLKNTPKDKSKPTHQQLRKSSTRRMERWVSTPQRSENWSCAWSNKISLAGHAHVICVVLFWWWFVVVLLCIVSTSFRQWLQWFWDWFWVLELFHCSWFHGFSWICGTIRGCFAKFWGDVGVSHLNWLCTCNQGHPMTPNKH